MAELRQDFILNPDGDFPLQDTFVNGVQVETPYGSSDEQHKLDMIRYFPGHLKKDPNIGFGAFQYLNSETSNQSMMKSLKINFEADGYSVNTGSVSPIQDGRFTINTSFIKRK